MKVMQHAEERPIIVVIGSIGFAIKDDVLHVRLLADGKHLRRKRVGVRHDRRLSCAT